MRMKRQLAYRTAAYAGIVTQVVFGLVLVAIFAAFYANGIKAPMTLPQVTTYIWLGQAFFAMTPYSVFPDAELREQIRDGSVATELLRPVDLHSLWMARTLASKLAPTALRCVPVTSNQSSACPVSRMSRTWAVTPSPCNQRRS